MESSRPIRSSSRPPHGLFNRPFQIADAQGRWKYLGGYEILEGMAHMGELTSLDYPIDVMYLIHKALRAEVANVERVAEELEEGGRLQNFRLAFNSWAT